LTRLERNCLHVIYERLSAGDEFLREFEAHFLQVLKEEVIDDPYSSFAALMGDLEESYDTTKTLIESYLAKDPIDVFQAETSGAGERT
jgi:hypothetical protein